MSWRDEHGARESIERFGEAVLSADKVRAAALQRARLFHGAKEKVLARAVERLEAGKAPPKRLAEAGARLEAHRKVAAPLEQEVVRAQIAAALVRPGRDALLLHGRVLDAAQRGVAGLTVAALAEAREVVSYTGTDARGYFTIKLERTSESETERSVRLQVSNASRAVLYRDREAVSAPLGRARYVEIALGDDELRGIAPPPGAEAAVPVPGARAGEGGASS